MTPANLPSWSSSPGEGSRGSEPSTRPPRVGAEAEGSDTSASVGGRGAGGCESNPIADGGWMLVTPANPSSWASSSGEGSRGPEPSTRPPGVGTEAEGSNTSAPVGDGGAGGGDSNPIADWRWMLVTFTKLPSCVGGADGGDRGSEPLTRPPDVRGAAGSEGAASVGGGGTGGGETSPTEDRGSTLVTPAKLLL